MKQPVERLAFGVEREIAKRWTLNVKLSQSFSDQVSLTNC